MANLTSIAQRLNDVEINNNAPVSSQTQRRVGSDINYLLDYLGIINGATIGGPITGLNVFSPVQSVSYSATYTNAGLGTPVSLFTFQGGNDRPLKFFKRTGALDIAGQDNLLPIYELLNLLATASTNTVTAGSTVYIVTVNGIEAGRTTRNAGLGIFTTSPTYSKEITHAVAGTNTVAVNKVAATLTNTTVTSSFEFVAL